ncbi:hypothetical protein GXW82_40535 [Streptacidiphilus sp. 4-A2]|nr:hypothetical protein [Streptacidiphilus sp. 4-A2]
MDTGPETHRLPGDPFGPDFGSDPLGVEPLPGLGLELGPVTERELRPAGRLRLWQILPIIALATVGSLMFAFPLAFESGGGGAVVGMLGLLLTAASAGWGAMATRRAGYAWPGLPRQGSGRAADWRTLLIYTAVAALALALALWRVARISG